MKREPKFVCKQTFEAVQLQDCMTDRPTGPQHEISTKVKTLNLNDRQA
jgi:hypothetical protein